MQNIVVRENSGGKTQQLQVFSFPVVEKDAAMIPLASGS
jgi:hypothetical protein